MITQKGCSAFVLKIVAIVGMTACHIATVFGDRLPFPAVCAGMSLGGATFPIMALLLGEGYRHTSDVRRYAERLALFAVVSQVPYALVFEPLSVEWGGVARALPFTGNVLFTLLLGLGLLYLHGHMGDRRAFRAVFALSCAASVVLDWGVVGPVMVLAPFVVRGDRLKAASPALIAMAVLGLPPLADLLCGDLSALPAFLYAAVGGSVAAVLSLAYSGKRGRAMKWFFYAYYPLHIALLGLLRAWAYGIV